MVPKESVTTGGWVVFFIEKGWYVGAPPSYEFLVVASGSLLGVGVSGSKVLIDPQSAASWIWRPVMLLAGLAAIATSAGCILTGDLPDPALDIPATYNAGRPATADASPTLDWWRGFRSSELTDLMEEAQTVNLDIAAATARIIQADQQARIAGAALLPSVSIVAQGTYSRTSGS